MGRRFRDEDDAYDHFVQRGIDAEMFPDLDFVEETHQYFLNGAEIPSVTKILDLIRGQGGSDAQREYKRQIGKALDKAIELDERGDLDFSSLDQAVAPFFEGWVRFKRDSGFRVLLSQPLVYSKKLRIAGTADVIGTRNGSGTPDELLDTKCVWTMDPATAIQTGGYSLLAQESLGLRVKKRGGVQLLRDGSYKFYPYNDPLDEQVFKACLSLYSWKRLHR